MEGCPVRSRLLRGLAEESISAAASRTQIEAVAKVSSAASAGQNRLSMSGLHAYVIAVLPWPDMDCGAQARYSQQMIRRFARVLAWLLLAAILFVTISPIRMRPETGEPADVERLIAFAVVGFAFILGYPRHWILVVCLVVGSAFAFEAVQLLSPSRHAHLHDAAIKAIGGVGGILAGAVFNFFRPSLFQAPGED